MRLVLCLVVAAVAAMVTNAFSQQERPQRLTLVRDAVLSSPEGPSALSDVSDLVVGRDRSTYIVQAQDRSVRKISPDGRVITTFGRGGRGPGEFQMPAMGGWRGDTLIVSDPYAHRLVGFLPDGRNAFTRTYSTEGFLPRTVLTNGLTLGYQIPLSKAIFEGRQTSTDLLTVTSVHGSARVFARLPMRHHTARVVIGSGENRNEAFFPQPFADADLFDVDPEGRWIVSVSRAVPTAPQGRFFLVWRAPGGSQMRLISVPYQAVRLTGPMLRDTVSFYTDMFVRAFPGIPRARLSGYVRQAVFTPRYLPPVAAIVSGMDGTTWVKRSSSGGGATWMVFSPAGKHVADVTGPRDGNILAATARSVWAVSKGVNDVPVVTRFNLRQDRR